MIREARRAAYKEHAKFTAIYIDTFETRSESRAQDHYVHKNLMLAKSLGAEITGVICTRYCEDFD